MHCHPKIWVLFIFSCVYSLNTTNFLFSQTLPSDSSASTKKQIDIKDAWKSVVKKDTSAKQDTSNTKSKKQFTILPYPGYALVTGFQLVLTTNISFYMDRNKDAKISSILINNLYTQYNQILNLVNSNIWTKNGEFNLLGDYRLYKFPTNTFGLGSTSSFDDKQPVDFSYLKIYEVAMKKINGNLSGGMGYDLDYHWGISETKDASGDSTILDKYGFTKTSTSSGITLNLQYDDRLNCNNPSKGTYVFLELRSNLQVLGSNSNWQSMLLDVRKYIPLSKKSGNVLALWSYNWITVKGDIPYFDLPSLGWDHYNNTGRGFVQGRYRGWNMIDEEAEYRYRITKNGLLGGVVFASASTFTEYPNNLFEKINPGVGVGLRIRFNKISNTNLAIDYGRGTQGSNGFSFNLNEVF